MTSKLETKRKQLADTFTDLLPSKVPVYPWPAIPQKLPCVTIAPGPGTYAVRDSMCGLQVDLTAYLLMSANLDENGFDLIDEWIETIPTIAVKAGLTFVSANSPSFVEIGGTTYLACEVRLQGNP